jgi:hypothetical protein
MKSVGALDRFKIVTAILELPNEEKSDLPQALGINHS